MEGWVQDNMFKLNMSHVNWMYNSQNKAKIQQQEHSIYSVLECPVSSF